MKKKAGSRCWTSVYNLKWRISTHCIWTYYFHHTECCSILFLQKDIKSVVFGKLVQLQFLSSRLRCFLQVVWYFLIDPFIIIWRWLQAIFLMESSEFTKSNWKYNGILKRIYIFSIWTIKMQTAKFFRAWITLSLFFYCLFCYLLLINHMRVFL